MRGAVWDVALFTVLVLAAVAHVHGAILTPGTGAPTQLSPARIEEKTGEPAFGVFIPSATDTWQNEGTTRV